MPITSARGDITLSRRQVVLASVDPVNPNKGSVFPALQAATQGQLDNVFDQLRDASEGDTLIIPVHSASFQAVALVVDRQDLPLQSLLEKAFETVDLGGWNSLSVAAIRLGNIKGVGGSSEEKLDSYCRAARSALASPRTLYHIEFLFYGDDASESSLREKLQDPKLCTKYPEASVTMTRPVPDFQDEIACISGDGKRLGTPNWRPGSAGFLVTDLESEEIVSEFELSDWGEPARLDALAFDHTGQRLLTAVRFYSKITMFDVSEGRRLRMFEAPKHARIGAMRNKAVAFSEDGTLVAGGFGRWVGVWEADSGRLVGDFPMPQPLRESLDYNEAPCDIRFSQDNSLLYVGTGDYHTCTLDLKSGAILSVTEHESHEVIDTIPTVKGITWLTKDDRIWPEGRKLRETDWSQPGRRPLTRGSDSFPKSSEGVISSGRFKATQADDEITLWDGELKKLWTRQFRRASLWGLLEDGTVLVRIAESERPTESLLILEPNEGAIRRFWPWDYWISKALYGDRIYFGGPGNRVEEYSLTDGCFLKAYTGRGKRATVRRHPWFPEIVTRHGDGQVDLTAVIHGGRRFYDFQKTNEDGSLILVQTTRGVAIVNAEMDLLGEIHFDSVPLVGHFEKDQVWVFTGSGHLYKWHRPLEQSS